ncbi:citrate/2-methylcitrate synthase [Cupriavidus necator]|uniref:citrate/2-methylcitrate synthase n=1 Tax=Cupriavidus necator TaxID=106590 RepID=UPI00339D3E61
MEALSNKLSDYFDVESVDGRPLLKPQRRHVDLRILDEGLVQTAICRSRIGRIDASIPRLEYRGYDVAELADHADFLEVAFLLLTGHSEPTAILDFKRQVDSYMERLCDLPVTLSSMVRKSTATDFLALSILTALSQREAELKDDSRPLNVAAFLLAVIGISVAVYARGGSEALDTHDQLQLTRTNFIDRLLHAALSRQPELFAVSLMNKFLILHAEHGLNCSTAVVRAVASTGADPFAAVVAGICAFKGPLHGGASEEVGKMYDGIFRESLDVARFIDDCLARRCRLMGFGHRIYKKPDPRAAYMKRLLIDERENFSLILPYVGICEAFDQEVRTRDYFTDRGLCPNPDLFNGILLRRIGFPSEMNTMLLCFSRSIGWLAHYFDSLDSKAPILRPQELYGVART